MPSAVEAWAGPSQKPRVALSARTPRSLVAAGYPLQSLTRNAVLVLIICVLASCEGRKYLTVTVVSATDEQPIANAQVDFVKRSGEVLRTLQTDSLGQVPFDSGFGGMMFGGPKFRYRISKDGFVDLTGAEKWPEPIKRLKPF